MCSYVKNVIRAKKYYISSLIRAKKYNPHGKQIKSEAAEMMGAEAGFFTYPWRRGEGWGGSTRGGWGWWWGRGVSDLTDLQFFRYTIHIPEIHR